MTFINFVAYVSLESFEGNTVPTVHYITPRTNIVCNRCYALLFKHEIVESFCCMKGKVQLLDWDPLHNYMQQLFLNSNATWNCNWKQCRIVHTEEPVPCAVSTCKNTMHPTSCMELFSKKGHSDNGFG
jgi:hypothetical protein